jgi:hypothetical protein
MPNETKTCFVVMGFGEKTDYSTGRVLNLDATYKHVIRPAVEAAGLQCVRADEIVHAGVIDVPMYKQLLTADVVIADLSTYNPNAFYELGVRHALRPFTTIVISENQLKYPFDVNHTAIRTYEHLGKDVGFGEAERFRGVLKEAIEKVLQLGENDSPVYTYLNGLKPPSLAQQAESAAAMAAAAGLSGGAAEGRAPAAVALGDSTVSALMEQHAALKDKGNFAAARDLLKVVQTLRPVDSYVVQQLALATYKAKEPNAISALDAAKSILQSLQPHATSDPETLGLWGAIHKRLWELTGDSAHLDEAIHSYEKGFYLKNDYYNGINLAFLLNVRASKAPRAEAIADWVCAERVRRQVIAICEAALATPGISDDDKYWIEATTAEAWFGLGRKAEHDASLAKAFSLASSAWMKDSTKEQLAKLSALLSDSPLRFIQS